jgi:hypothetical protein
MPWWTGDDWARMKSGVDCPMCADIHLPTNEHSDLIAELPGSYARLHRNQTHAGYTVLFDGPRRGLVGVSAVHPAGTLCHGRAPGGLALVDLWHRVRAGGRGRGRLRADGDGSGQTCRRGGG